MGLFTTGGFNQSGRFMKKGAQSSEDALIKKRFNQDRHAHLRRARREQNEEASLLARGCQRS